MRFAWRKPKLFEQLIALERAKEKMTVSQAQFDSDLSGFITAVNGYITASQAAIAAAQAKGVDLTAEAATVATALTAVDAAAAELAPDGTLAATPSSVSISISANANATVTATESNYSGALTAVSNTPGVATVSPASGNGPTQAFAITGVSVGVANVTITDANATPQTTVVSVTVTA
jgi:hypothetical protein